LRPQAIALAAFLASTIGLSQPVIGHLETTATPFGGTVSGVFTAVDTSHPATTAASVVAAMFSWSNAPCPGAVKIKFFHPLPTGQGIRYFDERGPFYVTDRATVVPLNPPVALQRGDLIGVADLTACGLPLAYPVPASTPGTVHLIAGDLQGDYFPPNIVPPPLQGLNVQATDQHGLVLLGGRFTATLVATDPRTGRTAEGEAIAQTDRFGYFSLPGFTGDPAFPEVVLKMADARALGQGFWVFHAPLTDVTYTLVVTDQVTGRTRAYTNVGAPGQLCGAADTSAFAP
jgi:hypothetical protein